MGRLNSPAEQKATLDWAAAYAGARTSACGIESASDLRALFADELRRYFALAALSRSTMMPGPMPHTR